MFMHRASGLVRNQGNWNPVSGYRVRMYILCVFGVVFSMVGIVDWFQTFIWWWFVHDFLGQTHTHSMDAGHGAPAWWQTWLGYWPALAALSASKLIRWPPPPFSEQFIKRAIGSSGWFTGISVHRQFNSLCIHSSGRPVSRVCGGSSIKYLASHTIPSS